MPLTTKDIRRTVYRDPDMKEHVCIAYLELPDVRMVLSVKKSKHRALAVHNAMHMAIYRFNCGPISPLGD